MTIEAWVHPTALGSAWRHRPAQGAAPATSSYALYATTERSRPAGSFHRRREGGARHGRSRSERLDAPRQHLRRRQPAAVRERHARTTLALTGNIVASAAPLRLGGNAIWGEWYAGTLDDVRVYNKALTAAEIQADMNKSAG